MAKELPLYCPLFAAVALAGVAYETNRAITGSVNAASAPIETSVRSLSRMTFGIGAGLSPTYRLEGQCVGVSSNMQIVDGNSSMYLTADNDQLARQEVGVSLDELCKANTRIVIEGRFDSVYNRIHVSKVEVPVQGANQKVSLR